MTDSPAIDWAWSQIKSPNLDYGSTTLTFLALAHLADEALNSPNGYAFSTPQEIVDLTGQTYGQVRDALTHLERAGSAVLCSIGGTYRVPEEAFNRHLTDGCAYCTFGTPAFVLSIRQDGTVHRAEACPECASRMVLENQAIRLVPLEAAHV